ncbi:MAG: hypothetical protein AAF677_12070 [Pseudomonadota bacterium]
MPMFLPVEGSLCTVVVQGPSAGHWRPGDVARVFNGGGEALAAVFTASDGYTPGIQAVTLHFDDQPPADPKAIRRLAAD